MTQIKRLAKRGFTLIELMIVVVIIGVLAAMALYGVRQYVTNAKTAEARTFLGRMSKDAIVVFEGEAMAGGTLIIGNSRGSANTLCATSTKVPATVAKVKGAKYQSKPSEWNTGTQTVGWNCLRFTVNDPSYFQLGFQSTVSTPVVAGNLFAALAYGDLDGDTVLSTFSLDGLVQTEPGEGLVLTAAPSITESNPGE